jgi:hypothetical protein
VTTTFGYYLTPAAGCQDQGYQVGPLFRPTWGLNKGPNKLGETLLGEKSLGENLSGEKSLGEKSLRGKVVMGNVVTGTHIVP